ncbi:hypothetical protein EC973_000119 [Apophysomyces ossiformis]|uniref:Uncharacterized protein n=1 Tax=Apophysomyces ossiformis TaxID=679940 RepID=A0A8H7C0Z2_9FUNG|nr:hypothetical protein EC973_000119 [Apophysomyces ossiformis]
MTEASSTPSTSATSTTPILSQTDQVTSPQDNATATVASATTPITMTAEEPSSSSNGTALLPMDDAELLSILGYAFEDWDDNVPELSEEEEEGNNNNNHSTTTITTTTTTTTTGTKRKRDHNHAQDDDDLFAQLEFVEVPLVKKQFVEDDLTLDPSHWLDDEEIRFTLDLIAS